ncbi:pentapeptide repeat-containing protein [Mucilaginibacter lappiensis]|uniref:pentapeptide repeat-containing protein n=1 Tax=Mucilaginibacter lappiensis TaxID=354630 RepID=UPI003D1CCAFF
MENTNERITISETKKVLDVSHALLDDSSFRMMKMNNAYFNDVCMTTLKITNANLSDLEIEGAQLGGAYIHNIGMPPKGHPAYDENAKQRPLRFEDCNLENSTITNCNLKGATFDNCNMTGTTINGILVEDLLKNYHK